MYQPYACLHMMDLRCLDEPYPLTDEQITFYRDHAYIKLKHVLPADVLAHFNHVITEKVVELNTMHLPMAERSTYDRAFLQVMNIWTQSDAVKQLIFSKRLAQLATNLMGVSGVRLYHDQALYKEPSGGYTPWHADQYYWPLANPHTTTAWIPLQATPLDMGPLEFSAKSHHLSSGRGLGISDDSEKHIDDLLANSGFDHIVEPFDAGEISFHAGWLYHRAGPNTTDTTRSVMCIIYMDEAMHLKAPENPNQQNDWETWCPGAQIGHLIDTPLNPVLYATS